MYAYLRVFALVDGIGLAQVGMRARLEPVSFKHSENGDAPVLWDRLATFEKNTGFRVQGLGCRV